MFFCFLKQDTTYAMRISDWSSDVCASDLGPGGGDGLAVDLVHHVAAGEDAGHAGARAAGLDLDIAVAVELEMTLEQVGRGRMADGDEAALDIEAGDRKSVVEGKSVSVRVDLGGRRIIKTKKKTTSHQTNDQQIHRHA